MAEYTFKLTIKGPEDKTHDFPIPVGITTVGRTPGNELMLPHSQVSRSHARFEAIAQECTLIDLGSSNGTYVNGTKLAANAPQLLNDGDTVKIGPFEMVFSQTEAAAKEAPVEAEPSGQADPSIVEQVEPPPPEKKPAAKKPAAKPKQKAQAKDKAEDAPPAKKKAPAGKPEAVEDKAPAVKKSPARKPAADETPDEPEDEGPPPPPVYTHVETPPGRNGHIPPGLDIHSRKLLQYLPGIYHTDFMSRFLGIFEATQVPLEWTIDNFDLFLSPNTAPQGFLPWLAGWFGLTFDSTWSDEQRRTLLREAHRIYARRGTRWALTRVLEIYTGKAPEIDDTGEKIDPFTFEVSLAQRKRDVDEGLIEALIDAHKPAHTSYKIKFRR